MIDHRLDVEGQIHQQLMPSFLREEIDDSIQRLIGTIRVRRRDTQMPGLGELNPVFHCLAVSNLADQNDVRILTKRGT